MIATILDYGVGNLHSLEKALVAGGMKTRVVAEPRRAIETDLLVLPGVGSFPHAARYITRDRASLRRAIERGLPTLGICLGLQLLFQTSEEGSGEGLALFDGRVTRIAAKRVPHIGWNTIEPMQADFTPNTTSAVYYANSFACRPTDISSVAAWTSHEGDRFPAIVRRERVAGVQFHPEKSSVAGVALLTALARAVAA